MELVLTQQDTEPLPRVQQETLNLEDQGLLNSNYKRLCRSNYKNFNSKSVFGVKQLIKSRQYRFTSSIETVLKVSLFACIMVLTFS